MRFDKKTKALIERYYRNHSAKDVAEILGLTEKQVHDCVVRDGFIHTDTYMRELYREKAEITNRKKKIKRIMKRLKKKTRTYETIIDKSAWLRSIKPGQELTGHFDNVTELHTMSVLISRRNRFLRKEGFMIKAHYDYIEQNITIYTDATV